MFRLRRKPSVPPVIIPPVDPSSTGSPTSKDVADWVATHGGNGLNLAQRYGLSTSSSAASNAAALVQAFSDSNGLYPLYLPAGRYPCAPFQLPNHPITWYGDDKATSVLKFANFANINDAAVSYDNTSAGHIQPGSPWYDNSSNGLNADHSWNLMNLGFEGNDWNGPAGFGFYFPNWASGGRTALQLNMINVEIALFQGVGFQYEINGLTGDSTFINLSVGNSSLDGVIGGSDSRFFNLLSYHNGGWGFNTSDHRNLQIIGGKFYGNGQVDHTCGGMRCIGSIDVINNIYAQDNNGPGYLLTGGTLISMGQIIADRNCVNGTDHSGMVINNCDGVIVDGYLATDSQRTGAQTHGLKVTGTNTDCLVRGVQKVTGPDTNVTAANFTESTSGGCTIQKPT